MRYWAAGFLLTVLLFGGALLGAGKDTGTSRPVPDADPGQTGTVPGQSAADGAVLLRVWDGEQVVEMTMAEYLPGVVRGEMPASFHQQALDAQAVAERTFICYHMASGRKAEHPDADVCMDYHCCNAYTSAQAAAEKWGEHAAEYEAKVQQAVRDTDGQVILYNGQPILAAFHSSSAGVTANSGDVWVSTLPYLHSVKSPEGEGSVPNYYSVRELPAAELPALYEAYGLTPADCPEGLLPAIVSTGLADIMMPVRDHDTLLRALQNEAAVTALSKRYDVTGVHMFCLGDDCTAYCSNYAPLYDIPEECATGTSNGALTYYLYRHGMVQPERENVFLQGEHMHRPSEIRSRLYASGDAVTVRVGGRAVMSMACDIKL